MNDSTDLEDALDGLQTAERYCQERGLRDLATKIAGAYQEIGDKAPTDEWDSIETSTAVGGTVNVGDDGFENVNAAEVKKFLTSAKDDCPVCGSDAIATEHTETPTDSPDPIRHADCADCWFRFTSSGRRRAFDDENDND